jgi:hypothetical protein
MGRFDALTQVEEPKTPTPPVVPPSSKVQQTAEKDSQTHEVKKTSKLANQQTSKLGNSSTMQKAKTPVSPISRSDHMVDTSSLTSKEKTKYGTYLTNESIKKINLRAIETNRDSHQVLQEAVNLYFEKLAK